MGSATNNRRTMKRRTAIALFTIAGWSITAATDIILTAALLTGVLR